MIVDHFYGACNWAYEAWVTYRHFFEEGRHIQRLMKVDPYAGPQLIRLAQIAKEHLLLQVAKLHDPPANRSNITLSLPYVLKYGGWPEDVRAKLDKVYDRLVKFAKPLKNLRNRILAHHDLAAILADEPLGKFGEGDDVAYFKDLQEFVDIVHDDIIGGPLPFVGTASNDAFILADRIRSGEKLRRFMSLHGKPRSTRHPKRPVDGDDN